MNFFCCNLRVASGVDQKPGFEDIFNKLPPQSRFDEKKVASNIFSAAFRKVILEIFIFPLLGLLADKH